MKRNCFRGHYKFRSLDGLEILECSHDHYSLHFLQNDCLFSLVNRYLDNYVLISDWYEFLEPSYVH